MKLSTRILDTMRGAIGAGGLGAALLVGAAGCNTAAAATPKPAAQLIPLAQHAPPPAPPTQTESISFTPLTPENVLAETDDADATETRADRGRRRIRAQQPVPHHDIPRPCGRG
jgi:hypothetical protein